jgi:4-carboxymuconolactone decarboxylase
MTPRIAPLMPPYDADVRVALHKWMPPGSGEPLILFRTLGRHSQLSERMRPLGAALLSRGILPARTRELLILRTCARCRAEYEWGVHVTAFAAAVGVDEWVVERTARCPPAEVASSDLPDDVLLRLVDELHDGAAVADSTWSLLAARFEESALLEMLAIVGFYHLISFVANGARIELEPWAARFPTKDGPALSGI